MDILLICNYQREIPPFMITMVKCAEMHFDRIEYVNPTLYNDNSSAIVSDKVVFTPIRRKRTVGRIFGAIRSLFRKEVITDIIKAIRNNKYNRAFLMHLASEIYPSEVMFQSICNIINEKYKNDRVCLLAAWFDCNAYTVARIKTVLPHITAASFAHAFEVNPERSVFIDISLNDYKHTNLDQVTFISKKVLKSYLELMEYTNEEYLRKIEVCYLGSQNKERNVCLHGGDKLQLCSCAGMTEVKRIDLILDALESWGGQPIVWTHIGTGPLYEHICRRAQVINQANQKVTIRLLGKMNNQDVHKYYKENSVDLFINVSSSEGLPVSLMEAISYGIPVIATDVGGTSEIVTTANGFLIERDLDAEKIRKVISQYVALPIEQKEEMRFQAQKMWEEKFDSDKNLSTYFRRLRALMEL